MFKADSTPIVAIRYVAYIDINCWNFSIVLIIIIGMSMVVCWPIYLNMFCVRSC